MIEVTQADREAIAILTEGQPAYEEEYAGEFSRVANQFRSGELDGHNLLQALTAHRQQAVDEATRPLVEALQRIADSDQGYDQVELSEIAKEALAQHTGGA